MLEHTLFVSLRWQEDEGKINKVAFFCKATLCAEEARFELAEDFHPQQFSRLPP